jgi:hypothetical protein
MQSHVKIECRSNNLYFEGNLMLKIKLFLAAMLVTSYAEASSFFCNLSDNGILIKSYSEQLDSDGSAFIQSEKYDKYIFGATAEDGEVSVVWCITQSKKTLKEALSISKPSSIGTVIKFECDMLNN